MEVTLGGIAALITALVTLVSASVGAAYTAWRFAVEKGKKEQIAEQVTKTLAAKDLEIAELKEDKQQLEAWVDALTRPPGRSS